MNDDRINLNVSEALGRSRLIWLIVSEEEIGAVQLSSEQASRYGSRFTFLIQYLLF